ncbi:hypothetical protein C7T35_40295 [Variovorax sp. WS11]|nr:hypothetical protein C7T35_40295 [Variovorax sp. WS11]
MMGQHMRPSLGTLGQPGDFLHQSRDAVESDLLTAFIFLEMNQDIRADEQRAGCTGRLAGLRSRIGTQQRFDSGHEVVKRLRKAVVVFWGYCFCQ